MMNFKPITLPDKKDIDACFSGNIYRACSFSFANLFAWNAKFNTMFAIESQTVFIRFQDFDGQIYYMMPVGKMPLKDAFDRITEDAADNNIPFRMKGITSLMRDNIQKVLPGRFCYLPDRNNDEYIYLSEKLIKLSGKKLQSKRNHINRFKADNPDWKYFPLTSGKELAECVKMLDEWEEKSISGISMTRRYDYIATRLMLEHFNSLRLCGGAIRANGKIVAFTIGEPLTKDSFVVHVEKAFGDVNGAYTIINQQFLEHEASGFMYVNREEDMGLDNLRRAKMSYYPDIILEEAILIPAANKNEK
ncbi:MAG: phosphatidylglycerol lysyltransferase domain-containing protein [Prevotella sp.]|jgi:hypothetical protein|nr:phosphatidylglycerol lysyltransferase domain-containing protein [Prevotella sp.]